MKLNTYWAHRVFYSAGLPASDVSLKPNRVFIIIITYVGLLLEAQEVFDKGMLSTGQCLYYYLDNPI